MEVLDKEYLEKLSDSLTEQDHVLSVMAGHEDLMTLALDARKSASLHQAFNVEVAHHGITAQKQSGRCWMFSALNYLREITAEKMNVEQFEFSENYLAFYDKLEKANNWLNMAMETADEPLSSRQVQYLFRGIGDGNVWDQVRGLVTKYGLVPKEVMPETWASSHTKTADQLTNRILRKYGAEIRKAEKKDRNAIKAQAMTQIYRLQCILFGQPVESFDYAWRDKDNHMHEEKALTPLSFYQKYAGIDLSQYVHVICEPTSYEPMHVCIVSHDNGNMAENNRVRLNLEMDELADTEDHQGQQQGQIGQDRRPGQPGGWLDVDRDAQFIRAPRPVRLLDPDAERIPAGMQAGIGSPLVLVGIDPFPVQPFQLVLIDGLQTRIEILAGERERQLPHLMVQRQL